MITVKAQEQRVELNDKGRKLRFSLVELPRRLIDWQIQSRQELFKLPARQHRTGLGTWPARL